MKNVSCDVIQDLLPLYYDDVCSDASKKLVEDHLIVCASCNNELAKIADELAIPTIEIEKNTADRNVIQNIATFWNRSRIKAFLKGTIVTAAACLIIFVSYQGLFNWNIITVPSDVVEISNVSQLADGQIVYHVELTDGYALYRLKYEKDEEGNFYMIPLRPIVKEKSAPPYGLEKGYDFFDLEQQGVERDGIEIKALYYGTPDDHILIWQQGMELPKASEEIESMFIFN